MPVSTPRVALAWLSFAVSFVLVACGGGAPTPPAAEATMTDFTLTSTAFDPGGELPSRFTCDGDDVSPDVTWSGAPDGVTSFALVVDDPDANDFLHWAILDFAGTDSGSLPSGFSESPMRPSRRRTTSGASGGVVRARRRAGTRTASGSTRLDAPLALAGAPSSRSVRDALEGASILGTAEVTATYQRVPQGAGASR